MNFVARTAIWALAFWLWVSLNVPSGSWPRDWTSWSTVAGASVVAMGVSLYCAAALALARARPETPAPDAYLLTEGPYRRTRNPLYLSAGIVVVGLTLVLRAWTLPQLSRTAVLFVVAHLLVVFIEEPATRRRFGGAYDDYCRRTPRWWPRMR